MIELPVENIYDQLPYPNLSHSQTHPDNLAMLATLLGLQPAPVTACRVLELGCAAGANLLPMAYALRESEFVGVDYSGHQIEAGRRYAAELGLANLRLIHADVMDFPADLGHFDYIIAHGLYSWVPDPVRDQILQICRQVLAPQGVAYISYNAYPGWHMMNMVREMMLYHIRQTEDLGDKPSRARELITFLAQAIPEQFAAYRSFVNTYAEMIMDTMNKGPGVSGDSVLLHDELSEVNEPFYFHQFMERAAGHGLQYLCEADFTKVMASQFPAEILEQLRHMARDTVDLEQYLDFLSWRTFRQTLLCHQEAKVNRTLRPENIMGFLLATRARPESAEPDLAGDTVLHFRGREGVTFSTNHPLTKAAFVHLSRVSPQSVPFGGLVNIAARQLGMEPGAIDPDQVSLLAANVFRAFSYSNGLMEMHVFAPEFVSQLSKKPVANPFIRWQASRGSRVTNPRHERIVLEGTARFAVLRLDGEHTRDDLLQELLHMVESGELGLADEGAAGGGEVALEEALAKELDANLAFLADAALLIA